MASLGKELLTELRKARRSAALDVELTDMELVVLAVVITKPGRDPAKLAKGLGLRAKRVAAAWSRLRDEGLIAPRDDAPADELPVYEATDAGKHLASAALMAAELADFEPDLLRSLRAHELKAPFWRPNRWVDP